MKSPYEKQISKKAGELEKILSKKNFHSEIPENSWEEYCVAINLYRTGKLIGDIKLYYSPKKNSHKYVYRIKNDKLKEELINLLEGKQKDIYKNKGYEIDVDGSYQNGQTGYGAIIRKDGKVIKELSGIVEKADVDGSRQVAGELRASTEAVEYCLNNSIKEITIYYDYDGVRKWAKGEWKAKKPVSKEYAEFMKSIKLKIHWVKIKSHSGFYWNELADKLACKLIINN
jgi:ribonuclease H-related protein